MLPDNIDTNQYKAGSPATCAANGWPRPAIGQFNVLVPHNIAGTKDRFSPNTSDQQTHFPSTLVINVAVVGISLLLAIF